jgi:hypothetical protein
VSTADAAKAIAYIIEIEAAKGAADALEAKMGKRDAMIELAHALAALDSDSGSLTLYHFVEGLVGGMDCIDLLAERLAKFRGRS